MENSSLFDTVLIVGIGLMGGCFAKDLRRLGLCKRIIALDTSHAVRAEAAEIGLADLVTEDVSAAGEADLIMLAVPVLQATSVLRQISPHLKAGAILTDLVSVKQCIVEDVTHLYAEGILTSANPFVPAHPIAGSEKSGPLAAFEGLFLNRWTILTPMPFSTPQAVNRVEQLWQALGANVTTMTPKHHDQILAMTSHLPHLLAYTLVSAATDLGTDLQQEVIQYSAGGFRDFTRLAGSDPTMWRDIFLSNKESVLGMLQRFQEEVSALQKAIRQDKGGVLLQVFTETKAVREKIIAAKQN